MKRRSFLFAFCASLACAPAPKGFDQLLPEHIEGGWRRGAISPVSAMPSLVTQSGVEDSAQTRYTGPGTVQVRAFRMRAETSAFELIQKWRQSDGLAVYKGPFFFVAEQESGNGQHAAQILRALQAAVGASN